MSTPQDFALVYGDESSASPPAFAAQVSRRRSARVSHAASSSRRISFDAGIQPGPFVPDHDYNGRHVGDEDFCRSQSRCRRHSRHGDRQRRRRSNSSSYAAMFP